jgi:hypothetical protein
MTTQPVDFNKRIEQYVKLRDRIKEMKDEFETKVGPYASALEQLNTMILDHLNNVKADSVATPSGTAYRTPKRSASLADPDAFMSYVVANEAWSLLDRKANVTAVFDFIDTNKALPPGVNVSQIFVAGVRRK